MTIKLYQGENFPCRIMSRDENDNRAFVCNVSIKNPDGMTITGPEMIMADQIIRRWNAHDALVKALRNFLLGDESPFTTEMKFKFAQDAISEGPL